MVFKQVRGFFLLQVHSLEEAGMAAPVSFESPGSLTPGLLFPYQSFSGNLPTQVCCWGYMKSQLQTGKRSSECRRENESLESVQFMHPSLYTYVRHLPMQVDVRDAGSIPGLGRSSGEQHGNTLKYSCLDRGAWQATVHRVAKITHD